MAAPESIDLTPEHLKTPEGVLRVTKTQKEWDDKTHEIANTLRRFIETHGEDINHAMHHYGELMADWKDLSELSAERDIRRDSFLRAVSGK